MKKIFIALAIMTSFTAFADNTIQGSVTRIQSIFTNGNHDSYHVTSNIPELMVHEYFVAKYGEEEAGQFEVLNYPTQFPAEAHVTGLIGGYFTNLEMRKNLRAKNVNRLLIRSAEANMNTITNVLGAILYYDGNAKNLCGTATPFVLIIDIVTQSVSGIDINPCK